jgi:hypothetical protein
LYRRVQWGQRRRPRNNQTGFRGEVLTATVFVRSVGLLHGHWGPTRMTSLPVVAYGLDLVQDETGVTAYRENVKTFYEVIDEVWGTGDGERVTSLKQGFLYTFARVLTDHADFWEDHRLVVGPTSRKKLRGLGVNRDQDIDTYVTSSGKKTLLYNMITDALVKHRGPLEKWDDLKDVEDEDEESEEE